MVEMVRMEVEINLHLKTVEIKVQNVVQDECVCSCKTLFEVTFGNI
jgi:hypothetical protein